MIKFAPDGYPYIVTALFVTFITSLLLLWSLKTGGPHLIKFYLLLGVSFLSFIISVFIAFFFRDPERVIPQAKGLLVSPADGKVILIRDTFEDDYLKSETREVSIFMSPLDVHVNRVPCDGRVIDVKHTTGKFLSAYKDDASLKNENIVLLLEGDSGKILVRQVAGFIARRAVCRAKVGDMLRRGERYGMIKFGSRLDIYLPKDVRIMVQVGDKVKAGETVIAADSSRPREGSRRPEYIRD